MAWNGLLVLSQIRSSSFRRSRSAARQITSALTIPTIGIGFGKHCDGQILVTHDLIGLFPWFTPKFVSPEARVAGEIRKKPCRFLSDARNPGKIECWRNCCQGWRLQRKRENEVSSFIGLGMWGAFYRPDSRTSDLQRLSAMTAVKVAIAAKTRE